MQIVQMNAAPGGWGGFKCRILSISRPSWGGGGEGITKLLWLKFKATLGLRFSTKNGKRRLKTY